jgi:predicted extracellular nuclease
VIEDDATGDVEISGVFDPATDGIDFYESLEGMRVQVNDAVVVGPRNDFGELWVLPDDGANAGLRTNRDGIVVRPGDFNPERIQLDDALSPTPSLNVGDHFTEPIIGVLDYNFGNFELLPTATGASVGDGVTRETNAGVSDPDQLSVGAFNVENLDPGDSQAKFDELAELIVDHLQSPDLLSLEEVQDNNGPTNDAVVDANVTVGRLIDAISAAGGPTYQFRQINPVDDQDGGEPGGNIRVAFLFRIDRGLAFTDRPGGGSTTNTTVVDGADGPELSASPGRILSANGATFNASRKPLAGEFTFNGHRLFAIANHFNSKGGDQPLFGRFQPPTLSSEAQRLLQAQTVNDFVDEIVALEPNAEVIVLGDFNDFEFSPPLMTLKGDVLNDLIETLPGPERYSYDFEGNSQTLDHTLVSDALLRGLFDYDVVHVNSEFAAQASDHEPQVVHQTLWQWGGFQHPVENEGTLNLARAGGAIPVKFSLDGNQGTAVFAAGFPKSLQVDCDTTEPTDPIEETAAPGQSGLQYDPVTDTYTYVWKTNKNWANSCRQLILQLADGSVHVAEFQFTK